MNSRPPCLRKLAQWWEAFQAMSGAKMSPASSMAPHGQGVRNVARPSGEVSSQMNTAAMNRTAVYLESNAKPAARPTVSHQRGLPLVMSRARAARPAVQKNSKGASGVMRMAPVPTIKVALSKAAAMRPAWRWGKSCSPASHTRREPRAAAIGPSRRMPRGVLPSSMVPARIQ